VFGPLQGRDQACGWALKLRPMSLNLVLFILFVFKGPPCIFFLNRQAIVMAGKSRQRSLGF